MTASTAQRPDLGPRPQLGYTASAIDRAADRRSEDAVLAKFLQHDRAGGYVIGGEMVVMKQRGEAIDPLIGWCMTYLINFIGYPAATVPAGLADNGLPVGMQIVAPRFEEPTILALASLIHRQSGVGRPPGGQ